MLEESGVPVLVSLLQCKDQAVIAGVAATIANLAFDEEAEVTTPCCTCCDSQLVQAALIGGCALEGLVKNVDSLSSGVRDLLMYLVVTCGVRSCSTLRARVYN